MNPAGMARLPEVASVIEITEVHFQLTTSRLSHCCLIPRGAPLPLPICGAAELLFPISHITNRLIICTPAAGEHGQPLYIFHTASCQHTVSWKVMRESQRQDEEKNFKITKTDKMKSLNVFLPYTSLLHHILAKKP